MAYCRDCGAQLDDAAAYCPSCGAATSTVAENEDTAHENPGHRDAEQSGTANASQTSAGGQAGRSPSPAAAGRAASSGAGATGTPVDSTDGALGGYTTGQKVLFAGGGLTVLGAFLPWITYLGFSFSGIEGAGAITLILALLAGGVGLFRWGRIARGSVVVLGVLVTLLAMAHIADPTIALESSSQQSNAFAQNAVSPGIGLFLTGLGGIGILAGPILDYLQ